MSSASAGHGIKALPEAGHPGVKVKHAFRRLLRNAPLLQMAHSLLKVQKPLTFLRVQKPITRLFGQRYTRSNEFIEIDITYRCNLKCINCNRSCRQAPSSEQISLEQVRKFTQESIDRDMKWKRIRVIGGEPTLHPRFLEILRLLLEYREAYSPCSCLQVVTNGYGRAVNDTISRIPEGIEINNMAKKTGRPYHYYPFNIAPADCRMYRHADYSNGCRVTSREGIGLTPYGYYPCGIAGGIDRVFGFSLGRSALPSSDDMMRDQLQVFCRLCGRFRSTVPVGREIMSPAWRTAYARYKKGKTRLIPY